MTNGRARLPLLAVGLAGVLALGACAARAQRPTMREAIDDPSPEEQLRRDLRAIFQDPAVDRANWGVAAFSLTRGDLLYAFNAFKLFVPASNQKLASAAVAADRLGWDFRFRTDLVATAPIGADGTIHGDLVIVGSGDPTINPRHPERWNAFDAWAAELARRGVRRIAGRLIGDDNAFEEPGWGAGWAWDDLAYGYGARIGALQYHENQVEVEIGPGFEPGAPAVVTMSPVGSGLVIDNGVTTGPGDGETDIRIVRVPGTEGLSLRGQIAAGAKPRVETAAVENPTRVYVQAVLGALARHGIIVDEGAFDIDDLAVAPDRREAVPLVTDWSPPLREIVDVALKWSRNLYAETLLHAVAPPGQPATADAALEVLRETLQRWGVPPGSYVARDGSGLSRYDYASPSSLVGLLLYLHLDPAHTEIFRDTLPQSGISGTLAERMKGTAAEGRVLAKSGSMSSVRGLSGYLTTVDGEHVVFSILVNGYSVPGREIEAMMDRAIERLVTFRRAPAR